MAAGAIGSMQDLMNHMQKAINHATPPDDPEGDYSLTLGKSDMQKLMGYAQSAHEAMTGAQHTPVGGKGVSAPKTKKPGVVYVD